MATSVSSKIQALLANNAEISKTWGPTPTMPELRAKSAQNGGAIAVYPRCVPEQIFGPGFGPALRNAGGKATQNVVESLVVLRSLANLAGIVVLHHTDCGIFHLTDPGIRAEAKQRTPDAANDIDAMSFGCLPADAFEASIAEDVRNLRAEKVLRGVEVRGMALDTFTGIVREIEV